MPLSDVGKKTVAAAQLVEKSIASSESKFMTVLNKMAAEMKKMSSKLASAAPIHRENESEPASKGLEGPNATAYPQG